VTRLRVSARDDEDDDGDGETRRRHDGVGGVDAAILRDRFGGDVDARARWTRDRDRVDARAMDGVGGAR
jgi:hypothetical protein